MIFACLIFLPVIVHLIELESDDCGHPSCPPLDVPRNLESQPFACSGGEPGRRPAARSLFSVFKKEWIEKGLEKVRDTVAG